MAKRAYIEANKKWLEEKAQEEGVIALPKGIYYSSFALALKERYVIGQCVSAVYQKVTKVRGLKDRHVYTCRTYGAHKL